MTTALLSLILLALKVAGVILIWILIKLIHQQKLTQQPTSRAAQVNVLSPNIDPLKQRALSLTRDRKTVMRLYRLARKNNPHQPECWCWEKVIWDLERDRH